MDAKTVGELMTTWCNRAWGPLQLKLQRAEARQWTIVASWSGRREVEITASIDDGRPWLMLLERSAELSESDLGGVDLSDADQAFRVRTVIERTLASRPWLLEAESDLRGRVGLKLRLWLSIEELDPNVFAASVAELVKVPDAVRWACLEMTGAAPSAQDTPAPKQPEPSLGTRKASRPPPPPPSVPRGGGPPPATQTPASSAPEARPEREARSTPAPPSPGSGAPSPQSSGGQRDIGGFCPECGQPYRPGHKFCSRCGAKVE